MRWKVIEQIFFLFPDWLNKVEIYFCLTSETSSFCEAESCSFCCLMWISGRAAQEATTFTRCYVCIEEEAAVWGNRLNVFKCSCLTWLVVVYRAHPGYLLKKTQESLKNLFIYCRNIISSFTKLHRFTWGHIFNPVRNTCWVFYKSQRPTISNN